MTTIVSTELNTPFRVASERIQTLDILRGIALMGIFIVHCVSGFSGWMFASPEQQAAMPLASVNPLISDISNFFFTDKSRTLFALMFGVSFFLQLQSAERRNLPFQRQFLRRLAILMLFGLLHAHLLFGGDILRYYAVGGLVLLLVYRWPSMWLLTTGLVLSVGVPLATFVVFQVYGINPFAGFNPAVIHQGFMSELFMDNFWMNHFSAMIRYNYFFLLFFAVPVTGIFLFGVWMARCGYLQQPAEHRLSLRKFCTWGLAVGFMMQVANLAAPVLMAKYQLAPNLGLQLAMSFMALMAPLLIILGFVSGLALLCLLPNWQRRLSVFAPAGRMTLTNYVMQSALGWAIFYGSGLGLYLQIGPALLLPLSLGLCLFQLVYSAWWLRHFSMGPLEWVWRWAVQGSRPVLRHKPVPPVAAAGTLAG